MASRSPSLRVKLALLLAGILFALLTAEIGLRILGISYPRWLQSDDLLGSVHRPGVSWRYRDEGDAVIRTNTSGYRDKERPVEKRAGTVRIAVLGDSYVEAGQVDEDEMVTQVMERELNRCQAFGARPVEVFNFGVSGYGTAQEFLLLRDRLWKYAPDIVVIGFLTGNDLRNNTARLRREMGRPYFVYSDSTLVYDDTFRRRLSGLGSLKRSVGRVVLDVSRVAQLISRVQWLAQKRRAAAARKGEAIVGEVGLDDQIYAEPTDPAWREAWQITEELLRMTRDEVAGHGAGFLVATFSNAAQVDPDSTRRAANMKRLGVSSLFYPDDRIRAFGEREGIAVETLARPLQEFAQKNNVYIHGFEGQNLNTGHWNENGHRVAGILLAHRIAREFGGVTCAGEP